jgi:MoxR-like ATPase
LAKVIVGQDEVIEQVLIAMFSRGHALLEGVPGWPRRLLISSLAESLHLTFKRIQFTPDSDAQRHDRRRGHPGRSGHAPALPLPARPDCSPT